MNPQEDIYSFPRYEYDASGVWHEKENQSLTAFLGNFPPTFCLNSDKDPPTLDDSSVSCDAAGLSFLLEKGAGDLSENCSVQINKMNENSEIKTDGQSGTPEVAKTEPKPAMTISEIIERPAPNKSGKQRERRLNRNRTVPWRPMPFPRIPSYRSLARYNHDLNPSIRFDVYGFLTHHDLWHVPVSHPMIPRWVKDAIWDYDMEQEKEFITHRRWMSLDYFPNHAEHCWLCIDYRGPPRNFGGSELQYMFRRLNLLRW